MTLISSNIKTLRKYLGLTQEQFSQNIGIKRSLLGAYEEGRADPRLNNLQNMANEFGLPVDILLSKDFAAMSRADLEKFMKNPKAAGGASKLKVLALTVDKNERENIELVPQKAAAGYLNGYADPEYLEDLPRFQLPMLGGAGTYRAFEISGDSMLPLPSGTVIIGQYVEQLADIRAGQCYILVSEQEGVVYKRVFPNQDSSVLKLVSDNPSYSPYQVDSSQVMEIWEAKAFISQQFPQPMTSVSSAPSSLSLPKESTNKSEENLTLDKLVNLVIELQHEVIKLKEK
jgi:transcriptional regulator with XRE-family HTH domain